MSKPTLIRSEPLDRDERLREMSLHKDGYDQIRGGLLEVVRAMVAGRGNSTDNNTRSSGGFNAWDYGVRRLREVFCGFEDWEKFEENGVEGIINHRLDLKITVVSTDSGTCDLFVSPRNRTPKGPATEKIVDLNGQRDFFEAGHEDQILGTDGYQFWELCVFDDGNDVRAELSLPVVFSSSYFLKFSERLFLVEPGEWERISIDSADSGEPEFEPAVRRK